MEKTIVPVLLGADLNCYNIARAFHWKIAVLKIYINVIIAVVVSHNFCRNRFYSINVLLKNVSALMN